MTGEEETVLKQWLIRCGAIAKGGDFEEWYKRHWDGTADRELEFNGLLSNALAYQRGLTDGIHRQANGPMLE
jgi:hypothetical protein